MECFACKGLPEFYCESQDIFTCSQHLADYLKSKGSENITFMDEVLQDSEYDSLKKAIKSLTQDLIASKQSMTVHLHKIQEVINSVHIEYLRKFDKFIKFYQSFTRQNCFPRNYLKKFKAIQSVKLKNFEAGYLNFSENLIQKIREFFICAECKEYIIYCKFDCGHEGCFNCLKDHDEQCLGVPNLEVKESGNIKNEALVQQEKNLEIDLKSEESLSLNSYQELIKCKDCESTENVYQVDQEYYSCYNCYYKLSQCQNCNRISQSCQLQCGHIGCIHCFYENYCKLCQSIQIENNSGKVCDKCSEVNCKGCNLPYNQDFKKYQNSEQYRSVKPCSCCFKIASLTALNCLHEVCRLCKNKATCQACSYQKLEEKKKKEKISDFKEQKLCENCGMFGDTYELNCKHEGCVYCKNNDLCKSCIFNKQTCINCERIIQFKYEFYCGHIPCSYCVISTCKICLRSYDNFKRCSRCQKIKLIYKKIGKQDCIHNSCLNCFETSKPCFDCTSKSEKPFNLFTPQYKTVSKIDKKEGTALSPNYNTSNPSLFKQLFHFDKSNILKK